ncbi:MAG TPA: transcription antitermination factor NusB [Bryobacteraceae bacterium]|nr:transcription antitermination factor NusB [Bryobacteraceae bacterium]
MARHRARRQALQLLYQWDLRRTPLDEILRGYYDSLLVSEDSPAKPRRDTFAEALFSGTVREVDSIDERITRHAEHWKLQRMPAVDRNILRLAAFEMLNTETPPAVAIDEALELARKFSGEESVHFVNGVLDAIRREIGNPATSKPVVP